MGRRSSSNATTIVWLVIGVVVLAVLAPVFELMEKTGPVPFLVLVGIAVGGFVFLKIQYDKAQYEKRRNALYQKYGDVDVVDAILARKVWQGQTAEQLQDSIGEPEARDRAALKTKTREVWKYHHRGGNRYALRVTVENDVVTEWDHKE